MFTPKPRGCPPGATEGVNMKKAEKLVRRYSEGLKRHVAEEVETGRMTSREAVKVYGVSHCRTVNRWVHQYGKLSYRTRIIRIGMKSEAERIRELEAALAEMLLEKRLVEAHLEEYEKAVPDLKKKLSTKQLKKFEENEEKLKRYR